MRKRVFSVLTICLVVLSMSLSAFAHSGRTDSSGGHKDNKNKSGLGGYHYHCGGYPAHLHTGGVCPYRGGGSSSSSTPKTVYATKVNVSNMPTNIDAGNSVKLNASAYPSNSEDKDISWESSDTTVATIDSFGNLTAVGVGTVVISAKTSRGTTSKFNLTVNEVVAESIEIQRASEEILIDDELTISAVFSPENTTYKDVEWNSENTEVATIDSNGKIKAIGLGTTVISATHKELVANFELEVLPIKAESIEIDYPFELEEGEEIKTPKIDANSSLALTATIFPENTTDKSIVWSVDDESVATISDDGVLTGLSEGTVIVTAKTENGIESTMEFDVDEITASDVIAGGIVGILGIGLIGGPIYGIIRFRKKKKSNMFIKK